MNEGAARLSAALADRYRIEREIGHGGMATVYLAHDLKHDRDVAIKVLHEDLGATLGAERFLAEIKTTAKLQHPHILPLLDSGEGGGLLYYVMPFVDGETLRERLTRNTQLSIDEAIKLAREIADALGAAHAHGIIHRDIKPENILLHGGHALVADFGIALAVQQAGGGRMTQTGLSLGTPHYMSPEQAMGDRILDARSDIYSLGAVAYEMLVGEPPFTGATAQAIVAKLLTERPMAPTTVRDTVPRHVETALMTALAKLPADRFESASHFSDALKTPAALEYPIRAATTKESGRASRLATLMAGLAAAATLIAAWALLTRPSDESGAVTKFALALPPGQELLSPGGLRVAFAPDGRSFVYTGPGPSGTQLWLRRLGELEAVPVAGSDGATNPVFSPDGAEIAFNTINPFGIKVVPIAGGVARTVLGSGASGGGLAWASDGYIYADGTTAMIKVRPDGTGLAVVMPLDTVGTPGTTPGREGMAWPAALPDARGVLMRVRRGGEAMSNYTIVVFDLRDGTRKDLVRALIARFSPTGHLLWISADGALHAQRFDVRSLELKGSPVILRSGIAIGGTALAGGVAVGGFGAADMTISGTGDLIYITGAPGASSAALMWVDRSGSSIRVDSTEEQGLVGSLALSPNDSTVAMQIVRPGDMMRIWTKRLPRGPTQLVTSEISHSRTPIWTPDGDELLYATLGGEVVHRRRGDGSGSPQFVLREPSGIASLAISEDGRTLLLRKSTTVAGQGDVFQFAIGADTAARPLLADPAYEENPVLSPDGRWLAYSSNESGKLEIYVRPFPGVDDEKVPVSANGGTSPRWKSGGEMFYLGAGGDMMAARVRTGGTFAVEGVDRLFNTSAFATDGRDAIYDVSSDGKRFLMLDARATRADAANSHMVVVQNFAAELRERLPK